MPPAPAYIPFDVGVGGGMAAAHLSQATVVGTTGVCTYKSVGYITAIGSGQGFTGRTLRCRDIFREGGGILKFPLDHAT